ncbi:LuxR C-terminal-related transcriptional regulator [Sphingobacterium sp. E70]|nr:LuxR C-terminal-related transcriptional regulator [Sphingobacterium sp. E70]ULT27239.1 LuxR C-terminal-related transcriptional regulator [Sphingobacterium sp. E70]
MSKKIADELCVSLHTINTHRKNILAKAGVKTPVDLIAKAIKEGWL